MQTNSTEKYIFILSVSPRPLVSYGNPFPSNVSFLDLNINKVIYRVLFQIHITFSKSENFSLIIFLIVIMQHKKRVIVIMQHKKRVTNFNFIKE